MKRKQMIYVGICDDGEHACEELERMLLHYGKENEIQMEIEVWHSGIELQRHLERQEEALDILFLDIEMPGLNGIEVGKYIRKELEDRSMKLIYISGKDRRCHESGLGADRHRAGKIPIPKRKELLFRILWRNSIFL